MVQLSKKNALPIFSRHLCFTEMLASQNWPTHVTLLTLSLVAKVFAGVSYMYSHSAIQNIQTCTNQKTSFNVLSLKHLTIGIIKAALIQLSITQFFLSGKKQTKVLLKGFSQTNEKSSFEHYQIIASNKPQIQSGIYFTSHFATHHVCALIQKISGVIKVFDQNIMVQIFIDSCNLEQDSGFGCTVAFQYTYTTKRSDKKQSANVKEVCLE
eukprot:TRINITY_DN708_c0_g2_i3.p1 TRINITY_DN708_c0_g2~~TRINITY_DN708_c0_g2_i3.p1  ORF type:complete len:211 (-),score=-12.25 TRINITY_DN708_c0_g2_i3:598-1230(-)